LTKAFLFLLEKGSSLIERRKKLANTNAKNFPC